MSLGGQQRQESKKEGKKEKRKKGERQEMKRENTEPTLSSLESEKRLRRVKVCMRYFFFMVTNRNKSMS